MVTTYKTNQERTSEYLKRFDREKTLKFLIQTEAPVILDVGANVGATIDEFRAWWPGACIHAFEPQAECFDSLEQRKNKNGTGNLVINHCAVGKTNTSDVPFYSHDISSGISGFNKINLQSLDSIYLNQLQKSGENALKSYGEIINHERRVEVIRLEDYLNNARIKQVHLLKIDTQGHEPEVLEGLGEKLASVDVVVTELMFYDYYERSLSFSDIERFLLPAGFQLYDISHIAKNPMNGRTDWVDVIYVNKRLRVGTPNA